jgi:hypothetical protein
MSKFAAAITMPVTNANVQENSMRSITSLVICTLPDCAVLAHPLCRPPLKLGQTVTVAYPNMTGLTGLPVMDVSYARARAR